MLSLLAAAADVPLGERIGPFVFWGVLAIIIVLFVLVWWVRRRKHAPAPTAWTRPEDYEQHHTVVWHADPARFTPTPAHWLLGVTAIFGICSGRPWDRLAQSPGADISESLAEAWGVRSREQLLSRIYSLLRQGHRVAFTQQTMHVGRVPDASDPEDRWRATQVQTDARGIRGVRFEAWDFVRAAMLTRAGYSMGWLTEDEATDTLALIGGALQRSYTSWAELGDHFLRARWFWGGNDGLDAKQSDAHDQSRQQALLAPVTGPWPHLPWEQALPQSRLLLIDALIEAQLVDSTPDDAETQMAALLDAATAERLAARG